jgi:hypothetical protein
MSVFPTFRQYTSWYTAEQPPGYSNTRIELEKAGSSWRKGCDKRRWSEHRMLCGVVKGRAKQLSAAHNADDVASYADAAAALDLEYKMKPSAYFTKYLKKKGNKAAAESDSSSGQAAAAQAAAAAGAAGRRHKRQQVQGKGGTQKGRRSSSRRVGGLGLAAALLGPAKGASVKRMPYVVTLCEVQDASLLGCSSSCTGTVAGAGSSSRA